MSSKSVSRLRELSTCRHCEFAKQWMICCLIVTKVKKRVEVLRMYVLQDSGWVCLKRHCINATLYFTVTNTYNWTAITAAVSSRHGLASDCSHECDMRFNRQTRFVDNVTTINKNVYNKEHCKLNVLESQNMCSSTIRDQELTTWNSAEETVAHVQKGTPAKLPTFYVEILQRDDPYQNFVWNFLQASSSR